MAVRSRRLYSANLQTLSTGVLIYTVPSGRTLILRTVQFRRNYATAGVVNVGIKPGGAGSVLYSWQADLPTDKEHVTFDDWWVLEPADELYVFQTCKTYVHAFGSLLFGAPE